MKASELVQQIQDQIAEHGDREVVSGVERTGYGEPVEAIVFATNTQNLNGKVIPVFDLILSDDSFVCLNGAW